MSTLFAALIDDAGLFPPTALHMTEALERHERDEELDNPVLTHRFLCPTSRLDTLRRQSFMPRRIGLIVDNDEIPPFGDLPVDLVEVRGPRPPDGLPAHVRVFLEVLPTRHPTDLPPNVGLKVRCGGTEAAAFPHSHDLAAFIKHCVADDVPFKATAGLHHAVRHFDPSLAVDRHGFLNLLLAVCEAVEGRDPIPVLNSTDVGGLVQLARSVPDDTARQARRLFVSYGSCSTGTPLEDLRVLGLIEEVKA
ncbi:hypothetical protein [Nonomuraea sp. NPDC046570]|uniref:hypothetical protein n=1 Tax=Nonomuraea sp. NPDC046570 TaxID=3155255 RepID=UPI0034033589